MKKTPRYIVSCLLFLVLAFAKTDTLCVSPFSFALLFALTCCRLNLLYLALMFTATSIVACPTLYTAIICVVACVVLWLLHLVGKRMKSAPDVRSHVILCGLTALSFFVYPPAREAIGFTAAAVVIAVIACYAFYSSLYAILVRGPVHPMLRDEQFCTGVLLTAVMCGFGSISVMGVSPFVAASMLCILLTGTLANSMKAVFVAVFCALAGIMCGLNAVLFALFTLCAAVCFLFSSSRRILAVSGVLAVTAGVVYAVAADMLPKYTFASVCAACVIFLCIPSLRITAWRSCLSPAGGEGLSQINRNRTVLVTKLSGTSRMLGEISANIRGGITPAAPPEENIKRICDSIARSNCGECPNYFRCYTGGATPHEVLAHAVKLTLSAGRVNMTELPSSITANCPYPDRLSDSIALCVAAEVNTSEILESAARGKILIAEQIREIAVLIRSMADDIRTSTSYDAKTEADIIACLAYNNIVCKEAVMSTDGAGILHLTLTLRAGDHLKETLTTALSKELKQPFVRAGKSFAARDGLVGLELVTAPAFDAVFGMSSRTKQGSIVTGDTKCVRKIAPDKVLIILSDGMGSGRSANRISTSAVNLIENYYAAGFSSTAVLSLTNKLLTLTAEESFSAVDVCMLELRTPQADFIKLGAYPTYIVDTEGIRRVDNKRPPAGMVEDIYPVTDRKKIRRDTMLVFFTDGIYDRLGESGIVEAIRKTNTTNPTILAKSILCRAAETAPQNTETSHPCATNDDMTVVCVRVFARN